MIKWIKMKRNERKAKRMILSTAAYMLENFSDVIDFGKKLFFALKDVPADAFRKELIDKIAELAHAQSVQERNAESE